MFLYNALMQKNTPTEVWKKYVAKVARLLFIWLLIYSPILLKTHSLTFQNLIFKTPAYLWYLTGMLVASVPFCYVKKRKILYACSAVLFIIGTLFGDTYRWLIGGISWYEEMFLTTRNGLFFALPLMCVGELTWQKENSSTIMLIISSFLLFAEITLVRTHANATDDCSMYLFLPLFTFFLVLLFREWNLEVNNSNLRRISTAIYVMQYGIITTVSKVLSIMNLESQWWNYGLWLIVICMPTVFYMFLRKTKIVRIIF